MTPYWIKIRVTDKGNKSTTAAICEIQTKLRECKLSNITLEAIEDEEDQQ